MLRPIKMPYRKAILARRTGCERLAAEHVAAVAECLSVQSVCPPTNRTTPRRCHQSGSQRLKILKKFLTKRGFIATLAHTAPGTEQCALAAWRLAMPSRDRGETRGPTAPHLLAPSE